MMFKLYFASDYKFCEMIKIDSLNDLEALSKQYGGYSLVMSFEEKTIIVYDDYLE